MLYRFIFDKSFWRDNVASRMTTNDAIEACAPGNDDRVSGNRWNPTREMINKKCCKQRRERENNQRIIANQSTSDPKLRVGL